MNILVSYQAVPPHFTTKFSPWLQHQCIRLLRPFFDITNKAGKL